jgi:hypothetical protein
VQSHFTLLSEQTAKRRPGEPSAPAVRWLFLLLCSSDFTVYPAAALFHPDDYSAPVVKPSPGTCIMGDFLYFEQAAFFQGCSLAAIEKKYEKMNVG